MSKSARLTMMAVGLVSLGLGGCAEQPGGTEAVMEPISSGKADDGFRVDPNGQYGLQVESITVDPAAVDFDLNDYKVRAVVGDATSTWCPSSLRCEISDLDGGQLTRNGGDPWFRGSELEQPPIQLHFESRSTAQGAVDFVRNFGTVRLSDSATIKFKVNLKGDFSVTLKYVW
jgi:hypothetical protein